MSSTELEYHRAFSQRVMTAASSLLGDLELAHRIRSYCSEYEQKCNDILLSRGVPALTIAVVGVKGQGKTWVTRQLVRDESIRQSLPSGVLAREATTHLHWIGTHRPEDMDLHHEVFHLCDPTGLVDLGQNYMLLDTPGLTDSDRVAAQATMRVLMLAPVKLLVIRRDQIRSAAISLIGQDTEGAVCVPIVTAVPLRELSNLGPQSNSVATSESLRSDLRQLVDSLRSSGPHSKILSPLLVEDFEASGDEVQAGARLTRQLSQLLREEPLESLAQTRSNRLGAVNQRFRRQVTQAIETDLPQLASSVRRLHEEADKLPIQVVEASLGSSLVLKTAVRSRLRSQLITDTSPLWFPYRTILSTLSLTQGAWDRVALALTGSIPSLFGVMFTWARNFQQSRTISLEMQEGIRQRMKRQIEDRLEPINRQFYMAIHRLKSPGGESSTPKVPMIHLGGIEELQTQSVAIFEETVDSRGTPSPSLQLLGLIGCAIFWGMLSGPIVAIYRQYLGASYRALTDGNSQFQEFPHQSSTVLLTSVLLSIVPVLIFSMVVMTLLLRRNKIDQIARGIQSKHRHLVEDLKSKGVLRMHFEDRFLDQAEFLLELDRHHLSSPVPERNDAV